MIRRRKPEWQRLISGLYVPPLLHFGDPYPCDDCCDCGFCSGDSPEQIDITLGGFAEWDPPGPDNCGSCVNLNTTFTADPSWGGYGACYYGYMFPSPICGLTSIMLRLFSGAIAVFLGPIDPINVWFRDVIEPFDCLAWSDFEIPLDQVYYHEPCDNSSPTCKITSIP